MTEKNSARSFHRILVALDRSRSSRSALEAAAMLAEALHSELHGLFVEDAELLAAANLPFAREVRSLGGGIGKLDPADVEKAFESEIAAARNAIEKAAMRRGLRWEFRSVRGNVHAEVGAAVTDVDILCIGRQGTNIRFGTTQGGTVQTALGGRAPVLIAGDLCTCLNGPIAVIFDPAGLPCVRLGAEIARRSGQDLVILVRAASHDDISAAREAVTAQLPDRIRLSYLRVDPADPSTPPQTVQAGQFGLIMSASEPGESAPAWLEFMALAAECPLLLVPAGQ